MEKSCEQYQVYLQSLCPVLSPFISPRLPPALLSLNSKISNEKGACNYCFHQSDLQPLAEWKSNFLARTFQLTQIKFACKRCSQLCDMDTIMELSLCSPEEDDGEKMSTLHTLINHFFSVNNFALPQSDSFIQATKYLQQVYSLSFSLKIALSNLPGLRIIDNNGENITPTSNFEKIVQNLIKNQKQPLSSKSSPNNQNKKEENKSSPNKIQAPPKNNQNSHPKNSQNSQPKNNQNSHPKNNQNSHPKNNQNSQPNTPKENNKRRNRENENSPKNPKNSSKKKRLSSS